MLPDYQVTGSPRDRRKYSYLHVSSFFAFPAENEFEISDNFGTLFMKAYEQSNCCSRNCCEQLHGFHMEIRDRQVRTRKKEEKQNPKRIDFQIRKTGKPSTVSILELALAQIDHVTVSDFAGE